MQAEVARDLLESRLVEAPQPMRIEQTARAWTAALSAVIEAYT